MRTDELHLREASSCPASSVAHADHYAAGCPQSIVSTSEVKAMTDAYLTEETKTDCPDELAVADEKPLPPDTQSVKVIFTKITSSGIVSKKLWLDPDGSLQRRTAAALSDGKIEVVTVASLTELKDCILELMPNQCLIYGTPAKNARRLMSQAAWNKLGCPDDATPRTKAAFAWPEGAGVLMLDYDAPKDGTAPLTPDQLVSAVRTACPRLAESDMLWMPSTSSNIYDAETGKQHVGVKGQRLYILLDKAEDIPRAGKALVERLCAAGYGRYEVSSSGSLLDRGLFDTSVWQVNRIDFAGGADCANPLEQRRVPELHMGVRRTVNSQEAIPEPGSMEIAAATENRDAARAAVASVAAKQQEAWINNRIESLALAHPDTGPDAIKTLVTRAIGLRQLYGDWPLTLVDDHGRHEVITVGQVLDNPAKYHGMRTLDPLEPDYDGGRVVGKLFLYSARPILHSFAHGGVSFRLLRQLARIEHVGGREADLVEATLAVMRARDDVYDFGTELVTIDNHKPQPMNDYLVRYWVGNQIQLYMCKVVKDELVEVNEDPPMTICRTILALGAARNLKRLRAVLTAPTLRPDGSVLQTPGYDAGTELFLSLDGDVPFIPTHPTERQAREALDTLWVPFAKFPYADKLARAAHFAALLTAAARPAFATAPAFGFDAPVQGSGKTLLAKCVAALATGRDPEIYPHIAGNDDAEMRKRLFTAVYEGDLAIVIDNVLGAFDSASMAALLTSTTYKDRKLGKSESASVPNNAIVLLTGNNMMLAGDMPRRVIVCRIDPGSESPFTRAFDLDPLAHCQAHRQKMVAAALTLIRFYISSGASRPAKGRMASFEGWDDMVRQTVVHIDNTIAPGQFGDVMELVKANQADDPEQESLRNLLLALRKTFGARRFTANEVVARSSTCMGLAPLELDDALTAIIPKVTSHGVGKLLKARKDRIIDGMRLKLVTNTSKFKQWEVEADLDSLVNRA